MSFFNDVGKFFNDVGTWVNDNVIQPIGSWWDKNITQPVSEWNEKNIEERDKRTKELQKAMIEGNIHEIEVPRITKDIGEKLKETGNESWQKIQDNIKDKFGIKEETEETGNTQETEETTNIQETKTPSIKELWEREDAIRKETQEREDTAYQRAIEDMRKAGINPNLVGVNPANSGGGIINATGQGLITTKMSGIINEAIEEINNTVKADENQKDRIQDIVSSLIQAIVMYKTFGKK